MTSAFCIVFIVFLIGFKILTTRILDRVIYKRKDRSIHEMLQMNKKHLKQFIPLLGLIYILEQKKKEDVYWGAGSEYGNIDCGRIFCVVQIIGIFIILHFAF